EYLADDVHWDTFETPGPSRPHSDTVAFYCEFECGHEECGVQARHYMLSTPGTTAAELLARALKSRCFPLCAKGELMSAYTAENFKRAGQVWQIGGI
ncbi:MAG: hypothetical protein LAP21_09315, partial [Acidobacteriia bacterium]|nr:hypothetical protein [Terriglobia bacterium]